MYKFIMDTLSYLLKKQSSSVTILTHCLLSEHWLIPPSHQPNSSLYWHLVLSGTACLETPLGKSYELTNKSITFIPSGYRHRVNAKQPTEKPQDNIEIICGLIDIGADIDLFLGTLPSCLTLSNQNSHTDVYCEYLKSSSAIIKHEQISQRIGYTSVIEQLIQSLFAFAVRVELEKNENPSLLKALISPKLQRSVRSMLDFPDEQWTVDRLAALSNMSRATFARHFKECTNYAPLEALNQIRMKKAFSLLGEELTISEISDQLGYSNESAFHKAFKKYCQITPNQYRKKQQKLISQK